MKILGIETSCDETACAVVEDGTRVLSNVIASQVDLHAQTGGVVPEVAAREHILKIIPVLDEALKKAGCDFDSIDAVAVTKGPGLISSLIIGTETASVISYLKDKPLIPVHHIIGHVYANFLESGDEGASGGARETGGVREAHGVQETGSVESTGVKFPVLVLTVSGGHNEIILMREPTDFVVLGETRDDAAGEAFDKVARILGLGYPGGPAVSRAAVGGNREAFKLPRSYLEEGSLDFSFSGLKTAVLHEVKKYLAAQAVAQAAGQALARAPALFVKDLAASFQEAVVDVLTDKLIQAYLNLLNEGTEIREIHLAGGVSANSRLREVLTHKAQVFKARGLDVKIRFPKSLTYCTDNAAMIAAAAYALYKKSPESYKKASNIIPTTSFDLF